MIIQRPVIAARVNDSKKWVMVYGRRKTGKTFLVKNFVAHDEYFFVKRDRTIISSSSETVITYETFIEILKIRIRENKVVIVDEFHRLGDDFFDFLHYTEKNGKIILISSTLFLSKKLYSEHSPLLGFFAEIPISLISMDDCFFELGKYKFSKKQFVELAVLLKEPLAIDYFDEKENPRKIFSSMLMDFPKTIPALFGEVFVEEQRSISAIYEGVARAIASGHVVSGEISTYLFARRLIKKDNPGIVQQYLKNLEAFGLIKKIGVYGKNRFVYKHISPLVRLYFYADEKYNISERQLNEKEVGMIIDELMPRIVEDFIRAFMAEKFGLKESIFETEDFDIDACLIKFKKPEIVVEVKWRNNIRIEDIRKAEKNLSRIHAKRRFMFVPESNGLNSDIVEIIDADDLMKL